MEIKGKVYLTFEQSATFRDEFRKLGYEAYCADIQNNFGKTDFQIDLFAEIQKAYNNEPSWYDRITPDDLIIAFFPCIYFTGSTNPRYYTLENHNYKNLSLKEKFDTILERADNRLMFYKLLYKMCGICKMRNLRLIIENPFSTQHYLHNNFLQEPSIIDKDRTRRGDYFKKPTGYWFFNCEPTYGTSYQKPEKTMNIFDCKSASEAGLCSEERSLISSDYARNWICDFVLGKEQHNEQLSLF